MRIFNIWVIRQDIQPEHEIMLRINGRDGIDAMRKVLTAARKDKAFDGAEEIAIRCYEVVAEPDRQAQLKGVVNV